MLVSARVQKNQPNNEFIKDEIKNKSANKVRKFSKNVIKVFSSINLKCNYSFKS